MARDPGERQTLLRQVEQLQATAARVQLPLGFTGDLYQLRQDIDFVKRALERDVADSPVKPNGLEAIRP